MKIRETLDDVLETAIILSSGPDLALVKKLVITTLNKNGIDGERFHQMYLDEYYRFLEFFYTHWVHDDDTDIIFSSDSYEYGSIVFLPILLNRSLLQSLEQSDKSTLQKLLIQGYDVLYDECLSIPEHPDTEDFIDFIKKAHLQKEEKWDLLAIILDPVPYYQQLIILLKQNIPVFHKACAEHSTFIEQNIKRCIKHMKDIYIKDDNCTLTPLVATPISLLEINSDIYCGIFWYNVTHFNLDNGMDSDKLALTLKALSDKTRLEILRLLKEAPSYNLEIAQKLSLSPATVSHHMAALIIRNFVKLEKRGGYTYYHLNKDILTTLLQQLQTILL